MSVKNITVEVLSRGKVLSVEKDGFLGENLTDLQLRCFVPKQKILTPICFSVNGVKDVFPMKDHSRNPGTSLFMKKIPVDRVYGGILTTKYSTNNLRLAVLGRQGKLTIWEIAIVSQDGLFFLTQQMVYQEVQFFKNGRGLSCPYFEEERRKWPQLVKMLKPIMEDKKLLPISAYNPPSPLQIEGLEKNQGIVDWWGLALQMGVIIIDKEGTAARVHWKNLPPNINGGLRKLEAGQLVSYQVLAPLTGAKSIQFQFEVRYVTPL